MADAADRLRRYVNAHAEGRQEKLAELLGVRQSQVSAWLLRRRRPGLKYVFDIEKLTGIKPETWPDVPLERAKSRKKAA